MISVSVDDTRDKAAEPAKQIGAKFPVVHDAKGEIATRYGVSAIPLNVVIDSQGKVVQSIVGADIEALKAAVEKQAKPK